MSTIKEIFPDLKFKDVRTYPFEARFSAPITAGAFEFNFQQVIAHKSRKTLAYVIDNISFSANVNSLDFSEALDPNYNDGFFSFDIIKSDSGERQTKSPITFSQFRENTPVNIVYTSQQYQGERETQDILFQLNGRLLQTPELVNKGVNEVNICVSTVIYEVGSKSWLESNLTA